MRCFVALSPDDAARERLAAGVREQQRRFPRARAMCAENLHLTLAFIGELDAARAAEVTSALDALPFESFVWTLDAVGAFDRARVLWAAGPDCEPLSQLAQRVRSVLDALRVPYDRKPFVAHVTLLRDLTRSDAQRAAAPIVPPIAWRAGRPQLLCSVHSEGRLRYEPFVPAVTGGGHFGPDQTLANRPLTKHDA
ncbi:MAG: RNA 2',3'-cyclic phosphodiesterase [Burkholderiaceae bacterium]|nr:RNA 2',3'-cyclic phosphodiesterase [Burkholderiaceae bacterium]